MIFFPGGVQVCPPMCSPSLVMALSFMPPFYQLLSYLSEQYAVGPWGPRQGFCDAVCLSWGGLRWHLCRCASWATLALGQRHAMLQMSICCAAGAYLAFHLNVSAFHDVPRPVPGKGRGDGNVTLQLTEDGIAALGKYNVSQADISATQMYYAGGPGCLPSSVPHARL